MVFTELVYDLNASLWLERLCYLCAVVGLLGTAMATRWLSASGLTLFPTVTASATAALSEAVIAALNAAAAAAAPAGVAAGEYVQRQGAEGVVFRVGGAVWAQAAAALTVAVVGLMLRVRGMQLVHGDSAAQAGEHEDGHGDAEGDETAAGESAPGGGAAGGEGAKNIVKSPGPAAGGISGVKYDEETGFANATTSKNYNVKLGQQESAPDQGFVFGEFGVDK